MCTQGKKNLSNGYDEYISIKIFILSFVVSVKGKHRVDVWFFKTMEC